MSCFLAAGLCSTPIPEPWCEEGPKECKKPLLVLLAPNGVCDTFISRVWRIREEDGQADLSKLAVGTRSFYHP